MTLSRTELCLGFGLKIPLVTGNLHIETRINWSQWLSKQDTCWAKHFELVGLHPRVQPQLAFRFIKQC